MSQGNTVRVSSSARIVGYLALEGKRTESVNGQVPAKF